MASYIFFNALLLFEIAAVLCVYVWASKRAVRHAGLFRPADKTTRRLWRHGWLSILVAGLVGFGSSLLLAFIEVPHAQWDDEFGYLLGADTFAAGRLANPTHPLWVHFESFHIFHEPTYQTKYPPGQALILAIGQRLTGHPIVGVAFSAGLFCAALCWMLQGWVPRKWALLGALLPAFHFGILGLWGYYFFMYWSHSYWGGMVAATGGALLFGALRRIIERRRWVDALAMGAGIAVLAISRPFEGCVATAPALALLAAFLLRRTVPARLKLQICAALVLVLGMAAAAMGYYNYRLTGSARQLPYQLYNQTYSRGVRAVPLRSWRRDTADREYRHEVMRRRYEEFYPQFHEKRATLPSWLRENGRYLWRSWQFYLGPALTLPWLCLPWVLRRKWMKFAALVWVLLLAAFVQVAGRWPHYTAPGACLLIAMTLQGARHLRIYRRRQRVGQLVVQSIFVVCLLAYLAGVLGFARLRSPTRHWHDLRAQVVDELRSREGQHLVVVRYAPDHDTGEEWVYNRADIDTAKIVWAREMDPQHNRKLLEYFEERRAWLINADQRPVRIESYAASPAAPTGGQKNPENRTRNQRPNEP